MSHSFVRPWQKKFRRNEPPGGGGFRSVRPRCKGEQIKDLGQGGKLQSTPKRHKKKKHSPEARSKEWAGEKRHRKRVKKKRDEKKQR